MRLSGKKCRRGNVVNGPTTVGHFQRQCVRDSSCPEIPLVLAGDYKRFVTGLFVKNGDVNSSGSQPSQWTLNQVGHSKYGNGESVQFLSAFSDSERQVVTSIDRQQYQESRFGAVLLGQMKGCRCYGLPRVARLFERFKATW